VDRLRFNSHREVVAHDARVCHQGRLVARSALGVGVAQHHFDALGVVLRGPLLAHVAHARPPVILAVGREWFEPRAFAGDDLAVGERDL
jgi:hypothetical protein